MRSGNTDAKREVQIIASWSLLSQSDWIRYTQHRVDWQDCWIESVRKDGFIQLVLLADRKWRAWLIFTKAMNDNATQYLRNQTSIRHIEPICYNLSINYTWISVLFSFDIQNGESKRFPKRSDELSGSIRHDILYCFIPQNKLLLFEDYYTKILTSVHWDLRHQSIPSIDWLVSLAVRGCVGRVETLLHSSIQSC